MAVAQYFVERLAAHNDVWMIKFDDEEYGPYKSQSKAVLFAIDAAEKLNKHGEKAQVVIIGPTWTSTRTSAAGRGELGGAAGRTRNLFSWQVRIAYFDDDLRLKGSRQTLR